MIFHGSSVILNSFPLYVTVLFSIRNSVLSLFSSYSTTYGPFREMARFLIKHTRRPDRTIGSHFGEREAMKIDKIPAALAAAVVVAGSGVHAAEVKGPTLYGQIHVSLDHLDNGDDSALNLSSNRSRFGIKGDIPIQDGLKAIYQLESEFRADSSTNSSTLATRNTFVGLDGGLGTVRA